MKQKVITIALLVLMSSALLFTMSSPVFGQSIGLYIYEITPQNSYTQIQNCTVGQPVTLVATIGTVNGTYQAYFDKQLVDTGISQIHFVSSNFTVPELPGGTYNITLVDVAANLNTTYSFPILTQYLITPEVPATPAQAQEGSGVVLNVTLAGGDASKTYGAQVTVVLPSPLGTNFTKTVSLTTSPLGTAKAEVTYPDSSFSPSDSSTFSAGIYHVYFNLTQNLAQSQFTIGFTDMTSYHRGDTVKIRAVGYAPSQTALLDISYNNVELTSQNVTVSDQGVVTFSWPVPLTAALGQYTARISLQTSPKSVPDVQTFQVPGYPVTFSTVNLAGEPVTGVAIEAYDQAVNQTYSNTTSYAGAAIINLEKGSVAINVYYNQVKVGELNSTISDTSSFTISCRLADLTIKVQDKNGVAIPFVDLNMTFQYVTRDGTTQNGAVIGQTDLAGIYTFNSTFTGISYTVQASKYGQVFNSGNNTISSLASTPRSQVNILCPDKTLSLNILDYGFSAIPNARITLVEQASGIFYSVTSDNSGNAQVTVTFGQYNVNVYSESNILLNSTVVTVTSDTQAPIRCLLYKLPVSVKVVDYFGNPVSNVVVVLSRTGVDSVTATTSSDGTVTFGNIIGGNVEITAYPSGNQNSYVATNLQVNSPTTVTLAMDKYIVFGGSLVQASVLATVILLAIVIVLLVLAEVYKFTGFRLPRRSPS